ncbi:hypothetical protein SLOPH_2703 [Spraguea lophii 42_110]|uniref:ISXO2-like transposase domain-containing protein n=1 Tax=Spraguea lophii (strain 42_110) TaxID=1358809 RepID=S7XGY4_SPRLO|nr:hypothetical protein SLOPH_2703 [Spraguea lophii 42_110]
MGVILEVDETVISRRGIIINPTTLSDEVADMVWILGVVDQTNIRFFFIKRVENRQSNALARVLDGIIRVGSVLCGDGYPSYPAVAVNLNLSHIIVNHSHGFVNEDGDNTNTIESFWSHLKSSMRKKKRGYEAKHRFMVR